MRPVCVPAHKGAKKGHINQMRQHRSVKLGVTKSQLHWPMWIPCKAWKSSLGVRTQFICCNKGILEEVDASWTLRTHHTSSGHLPLRLSNQPVMSSISSSGDFQSNQRSLPLKLVFLTSKLSTLWRWLGRLRAFEDLRRHSVTLWIELILELWACGGSPWLTAF